MSGDPEARTASSADATTEGNRTVTFRDLFAIREYRALYLSLVISWIGDYLARAAITVLVYEQSKSVLLSAAAFAVTFLPWVIGGTLLAALAERYAYRRVLIAADLYRMVLVALLLVPHTPMPVMLLIVFLASLGAPPTHAARSALQPLVVGRDLLPMAVATNVTSGQAAQVFGYLAGAALAAGINPQVALAIDVATFAVSALLVATGVRPRPPAHSRAQRRHLLRESGEGFRLVFGVSTLRAIAIMVFVLTMFAVVPEGLAAAWAAEGTSDPATRGLNQGLIMAAGPIGFVAGGLLINRLAGPALRDRLVRPLAVLSALALVPALLAPPAPVVALTVAVSGFAQGGVMPTLNGKFVLILPHGYRARAYGVMQTGLQLSQFGAVIVTGLLADHFRLPLVVGLWSVGGTAVLAGLAYRWPSAATFAAATEAAEAGAPPPARPSVVTTSVTPERS
ncbi:MFS transporter [Actinoplanes sp. URMC 104]|uniref:MFS transporter n=1 Tax=Actinoplanes sp. URMC 104 TaxID=3423409 RepID=UPI003F1C1405